MTRTIIFTVIALQDGSIDEVKSFMSKQSAENCFVEFANRLGWIVGDTFKDCESELDRLSHTTGVKVKIVRNFLRNSEK